MNLIELINILILDMLWQNDYVTTRPLASRLFMIIFSQALSSIPYGDSRTQIWLPPEVVPCDQQQWLSYCWLSALWVKKKKTEIDIDSTYSLICAYL